MNSSSDGSAGCAESYSFWGGVEGGVGGSCADVEVGSSHLMTREACFARCWIM